MAADAAPAAAGGLRQRLITAFLLGPLILAAVLLLPTPAFALMIGLVIALGAWEWPALAGLAATSWRMTYVAAVIAAMLALWLWMPAGWVPAVLAAVTLWWLLEAIALARTRQVLPKAGTDPGLVALGLPVLLAPWLALVHLHQSPQAGPPAALALLMLVWFADSAAYFAGRRWGRRKLAPVLSPGKTWAGLYGGLAVAAAWGGVIAVAFGFGLVRGLALVAICAVAILLSIAGDLYESLLKRRRGLKDAGALLPGHGGMLDRIDSMTAAAPIFALGLLWLQGGL